MKFDMNKAWNEAMAMIGANREVLAILAGLFFLIPNMALSIVMPTLPVGFSGTEQDMAQLQSVLGDFYSQYWWLMVVTFAASILGWLALMALLRDDTKPTVGSAIQSALKGLLPALGAFIIFIFGTSFAYTLLVVAFSATGLAALAVLAAFGGLILVFVIAIRFTLVSPIIVIDGVSNPVKALVRSWQLTKNNGLRLFGFFTLITVAYLVLSMVGGILLSLLLLVVGEAASGFVAALIGGAISAAVSVIYVAVIASIHRQLSGPSADNLKQTSAQFD